MTAKLVAQGREDFMTAEAEIVSAAADMISRLVDDREAMYEIIEREERDPDVLSRFAKLIEASHRDSHDTAEEIASAYLYAVIQQRKEK
jgi:predicted ArsR family transcriptional regulator